MDEFDYPLHIDIDINEIDADWDNEELFDDETLYMLREISSVYVIQNWHYHVL